MCEEFRGVVEKAQFPLKSLFRKTVPETFLHLFMSTGNRTVQPHPLYRYRQTSCAV